MEWFVAQDSIVRKIWGKGDTILFIFAGASAEFALNKAVDWLYFTGKLPADPLGRLFSTVSYARLIVFAKQEDAFKAIDKMTAIHSAVEKGRGTVIPNWAYQDVLYMLIYYSIAAFELLERKLSDAEKEEVFHVFYRVGMRMGIKDLPSNYKEWLLPREEHLQTNLLLSKFSVDLYKQYKKNLGTLRFLLLNEGQKLVVPQKVNELLHLGKISLLTPILFIYKLSRKIKLDWFLKSAVLPAEYKAQIKDLDVVPA
jgi:hypothetical protein